MTDQAWNGYRTFDRDEWSKLRLATPLPLEAAELEVLRGLIDKLDLHEVSDVYLPLSRLLNLRVAATQALRIDTANDANNDGIIDVDSAVEFKGQDDECVLYTLSIGVTDTLPRAPWTVRIRP